MDILDFSFATKISSSKLFYTIMKVFNYYKKGIIFWIFIITIIYSIISVSIFYLLICSISYIKFLSRYLILGILLFSYLLFDEIGTIPVEDMLPLTESHSKGWAIYRIYLIIIIMNCICGISRILCSIFILKYRNCAIKVLERCNFL